jgi:hypothetical protein
MSNFNLWTGSVWQDIIGDFPTVQEVLKETKMEPIKFPIGSRAWAEVRNNIITARRFGSEVRSFLVVGLRGEMRALLAPPPYDIKEDLVTHELCETYQIDPTYVGQRVAIIREWHLQYLGRTCIQCQSHFDYLEPDHTFLCWKCEV